MRGATGVTIQPHQILRLPRKVTPMLDPCHIWNVIYTARSNRCHHPTSPNTAPATKNDTATCQKKCPKTDETSFPMRGRSEHDPTMIRPWSDHETVSPQPASQLRLLFEPTTSIFYCKIQRFAPNLTFQLSPSTAPATKSDTWTSPNTAPATKSDTWTSPSTAPATKSDTWTSPNTAPATKSDTWTSPSIAPATQNDSNAWSSSHMKRHLQCAEQQVSPSNLTKYCACHAKWLLCLILVTYETSFTLRGATGVTIQPHQILRLPRKMTLQHVRKNVRKRMKRHFQCGADPSMIRPWSDHDPTMKPSVRNPPRNWGYFSSPPRAFSIVKYNVLRPILHSNFHQVLRLPRKVTLELHQILRLPRKVTLEPHQVLHLPRKVTLELHQILRLPRKVTLEPHQVLHLSRELEPLQVLRLPHWLNGDSPLYWTTALWTTERAWLYWTVTLLNSDSTELWLYWTLTLLNSDSTELWLTLTLLNGDWTLLNGDSTELWLYWTVTLLNSLLNCDSTELWLYWTVTLLNWLYWTLYWTVNLLNSDSTELWLYWTLTLHCLTLLGCRSYIGSFSTKLPLTIDISAIVDEVEWTSFLLHIMAFFPGANFKVAALPRSRCGSVRLKMSREYQM